MAYQLIWFVLDLAQHAPVRRLDEAVLVDPTVRRERPDQTDVRAFGRLDRADAAVVRVVHVAHFEPGSISAQAARAQRAQASLVGQLRERIGLIHELAELATAEELAHRRDHWPDIGQARRRGCGRIGDRHALFDHALHAQQADAELVLNQLAHGAHATVAEVIDVVGRAFPVVDAHHFAHDLDQVVGRENAHGDVRLQTETFVDLVAADLAQVVSAEIEEQAIEQAARVIRVGRIARA